MNNFTALFTLFAAVWGSFGMITKLFETLNERRDLVLGITPGSTRLNLRMRKRIALADWLPLWLGSVFFLLVVTCFFLILATMKPTDNLSSVEASGNFITEWVRSHGWSPTEALCYLCALFSGFGLIANLAGGTSDFLGMLSVLNSPKKRT